MQNDESNEFLVTRLFDAKKENVWYAWTKPELIAQWFAPGIVMDVREMDVRVGGRFRFADPNDKDSGEYTGEYITVNSQHELTFSVMDYSDNPSGVKAGFKVIFEELGQQTKVTLTSITPDSDDLLDARSANAQEAWSACLERLSKVISQN